MGWQDRDWGKFSHDEWDDYVATKTATPRRTPRAAALVVAAAAISGAAMFLLHQGHAAPIRLPQAPPANVVDVRWRDTDVAPASTAGRICLTDAPRGQICATYTVGEKPADVLTRQLNAQGLSVRSG
ncbi:MAG TPA: hypothetical protein VI408_01760 [Gaiellaceae bacterium]